MVGAQQAIYWEEIFKERENKKFCIIVLNNNSGYAPDEIGHFDYKLLAMRQN